MATIMGTSGSDYLPGTTVADNINGLAGNDTIIGDTGNDTMEGGADHDIYYVDSTSDLIIEEANADTDTVYADASYTLDANVENLYLQGSAYYSYGNELNNFIAGNSSDNFLWGSLGIDTMAGGLGNDVYSLENTSDVITEEVNAGTETVYAYASYTLDANVENLYLEGSAYYGYGNALNNYIAGNSSKNYLWGAAGVDTMAGGSDDDRYDVDSSSDVITEDVNAGIDMVYSYASYTLGENVDNLCLVDSAYYGYGNALNNRIWGNNSDNFLLGEAGNDDLNGGVGNDTMAGGLGSDKYVVDSSSDVIIEEVNSGIDDSDSVYLTDEYTSASYTLSDTLERLYLSSYTEYSESNTYFSGYGNALDNDIVGNSQNNYLWGGAGNDFLDDGWAGIDTMVGGLGDDTYSLDSTSDVIIEDINAGIDLVYSNAYQYTLGAHLENLYLDGSGAYIGHGNELDNYIAGNSNHNILWGDAGIDTMVGGDGNDRYNVDSPSHVIIEGVNAGTDWVYPSDNYTNASYTLAANVENLYLPLLSSSVYDGYGNALNNYILGNYQNNYLWGGAGNDTIDAKSGNDTIVGGDGNDFYTVDSASDVIIEDVNADIDSVSVSLPYMNDSYTLGADVENLYMSWNGSYGYGNALNNYIASDFSGHTLNGGAGNDTITGSMRENPDRSRDVLTGGIGADYFMFYTSRAYNPSFAASNSDTITDFSKPEGDKIALSASGFGGGLITTSGVTPGSLHSSQFVTGAAAADSSDRIIYNSSTGALFFDEDGTGAAAQVQFAALSPNLDLISSDFEISALQPPFQP